MRLTPGALPAVLGLLLTLVPGPAAVAQERLGRLTLDEAVALAVRGNPVVRAKEFEYQAVGAGEITAGLRPNPSATFLSEQWGGASSASQVQQTFSIGQPIELGASGSGVSRARGRPPA